MSKPFTRLICFIKGHKMTRGQWRKMVPGTIFCNWWCERCRGAVRMESKRVPIIIADLTREGEPRDAKA